jgi:hypothetical protein
MALTKDHTAANGLEAPAAYHKVTRAEVSSLGEAATMTVRVSTYKNKAMADADGVPISSQQYELGVFDKADSGATAYAKAYAALKLHPDFNGALDA